MTDITCDSYAEFNKSFPRAEDRLKAFLRFVSSNLRLSVLLSLNPNYTYDKRGVYENVLRLTGYNEETFPASKSGVRYSVFRQITKNGREIMSPVEQLHFVEFIKNPMKGGNSVRVKKTSMGMDFGDKLAALTFNAEYLLHKNAPNLPWQMSDILGSASAYANSGEQTNGLMLNYQIIKLLAENPQTRFSQTGIRKALKSENKSSAVSSSLRHLDEIGAIAYYSKEKDENTRSATRRSDRIINLADALKAVRRSAPYFSREGALEKIVGYFNRHVGEDIQVNAISKYTGIDVRQVRVALSALKRAGQIEMNGISAAQSNERTLLIWNEFLEPITEVANGMSHNNPKFSEALIRRRHVWNAFMHETLESSRGRYKNRQNIKAAVQQNAGVASSFQSDQTNKSAVV